MSPNRLLPALAAGALLALPAAAQDWSSRVSHVIVPQAHGFALDRSWRGIEVREVLAKVAIREQTARTTLEIRVANGGGREAEAVLLIPVPSEALVAAFAFDGSASEPTARLLLRDEARRTYDEIVARVKDPALLEFAGYNLIRSSVFPVPANGEQRLRITYEQLLRADGDRVDYELPRSESLAVQVPWRIEIDIRSQAPISMVYSPTHDLVTTLVSPQHVEARLRAGGTTDPGSFRCSYLVQKDGLSASLLAYPDHEVGGGYFLLMAGLPATLEGHEQRIRREVTLVLDRSGSMAGEKLEQALAAAAQVIEGLAPGESFNVIDYSSQPALFAPRPVAKDADTIQAARAYLKTIAPGGGTNIHDALLEALRQELTPESLSIVLFLTDGLPTVGKTSEIAIRDMLAAANRHGRRVFTFGVGGDVNVPLLDRISDLTRATSEYVLPGEDVEVKVARVFQRLYGPVLADLELGTLDQGGATTTRAVRELMPSSLPDLFDGDQLILLGQYTSDAPLRFRLDGNFLGEKRTFAFEFDVDSATTRNSFVPRLWASRKIAFLVDQIRQRGAELTEGPLQVGADPMADPRLKELADEILRLSTKFGILSEYTAFLATEGTDLGDWDGLLTSCRDNLDRRAVRTRSGLEAVNQGRNFNESKVQTRLNYSNRFWNVENVRVEFSEVQQVCDRAFFKRGGQWIDADIIGAARLLGHEEVVQFGSEAHARMLQELVGQGRQGLLALPGDILMRYEGKNVLVVNSK